MFRLLTITMLALPSLWAVTTYEVVKTAATTDGFTFRVKTDAGSTYIYYSYKASSVENYPPDMTSSVYTTNVPFRYFSKSVTGLPDDITFDVRAKACDANGCSDNYVETTITTLPDATPPTEPGVPYRETSDYEPEATFSWSAATDADSIVTGYEFYLREPSGTTTSVAFTTQTTATVTLDGGDGSYTFYVRAVDLYENVSDYVASEPYTLNTQPELHFDSTMTLLTVSDATTFEWDPDAPEPINTSILTLRVTNIGAPTGSPSGYFVRMVATPAGSDSKVPLEIVHELDNLGNYDIWREDDYAMTIYPELILGFDGGAMAFNLYGELLDYDGNVLEEMSPVRIDLVDPTPDEPQEPDTSIDPSLIMYLLN